MRAWLFAIGLAILSAVGSSRATAAAPAIPGEFRVATWNIRSGDGRCPIGAACPFSDGTQNCTDSSAPRNAWAYGIPQAELLALDGDPSVLALGLQEAWNCAGAAVVKSVLNWAYASNDFDGTALVARFGISGPLVTKMLSNPGQAPAFVIGADVCVNAACSATLRVYVAHLYYNTSDFTIADQEILAQAQSLIAWINALPHADKHALIGDFNAYEREAEVDFPCEKTADYRAPQTIRSAGYIDSWLAEHGTAPGMTATINKNGCGTPNGAAWKRIDYAFLKGLTPVSSTLFGVVPVNTPAPSDHYGLLAGFTASGDPAVVTPPPSSTLVTLPAGEILLRASDDLHPKIAGRWSIQNDATADGGRKWTNPDLGEPKIATALSSPQNYFEVTFTAPANTLYHLSMRMRAQGDSYLNDSIWVQFSDSLSADGLSTYRIGTTSAMSVILEEASGTGVAGWGWTDNGYGALGAPIKFRNAGAHTIRIQQREDGVSIDEILLSPNAFLRSSPGTPKNDVTMFQATQLPQ